jgi:hypothetical protein
VIRSARRRGRSSAVSTRQTPASDDAPILQSRANAARGSNGSIYTVLRLLLERELEAQADSASRALRSKETAPNDDAPILISRANTARLLNVSVYTVSRLLLERELEGVLVRARRMVTVASLHAYVDRNRDNNRP